LPVCGLRWFEFPEFPRPSGIEKTDNENNELDNRGMQQLAEIDAARGTTQISPALFPFLP
jgi:hypothetical protein